MKTIFRSACKGHFVQLPNAMLRDKTISLRARGLLAMVLTNQEDWVASRAYVREQVPEGRQAVASTFRELEAAGYAVMNEIRDPKTGKISSNVWVFYDSPVPEGERSKSTQKPSNDPLYGNPASGFPASGNPECGLSAPKNTRGKEDHQREHQKTENHFSKAEDGDGSQPIASPKKPRARDPFFDELVRVCGIDEQGAKVSGSGIAKCANKLKASGVSVDDIARVAGLHRKLWPTCSVTHHSIVNNWAILLASAQASGKTYQCPSDQRLEDI